MVVIEIVLVAGLLLAAWRVWDDRQHPASASGPGAGAVLATPTPVSSPSVPAVPIAAPSAAPTPGLRLDPAFIQSQMQRLGGDEAAMERLQWQLVDTVSRWAGRYVEDVVVPGVDAAEGAG
jgi:hypothetical protein